MCEYCLALLSEFRKEVHKNNEHAAVLITVGNNPEDIILRSYQHPEIDDQTLITLFEEMLTNLKAGTVFTRPMRYKHNPN